MHYSQLFPFIGLVVAVAADDFHSTGIETISGHVYRCKVRVHDGSYATEKCKEISAASPRATKVAARRDGGYVVDPAHVLDARMKRKFGLAARQTSAVTQIDDGQVQVPASAATQINDGQVRVPASAATQIDDGQVQVPTSAATQIDDGQVQVPSTKALVARSTATQIDDGQVQVPTSAATQIDDGQVQIPSGKDLLASSTATQIDDGQVQIPTSAATQIDDGQVQIPAGSSTKGPAPISTATQIDDGQIQIPAGPVSSATQIADGQIHISTAGRAKTLPLTEIPHSFAPQAAEFLAVASIYSEAEFKLASVTAAGSEATSTPLLGDSSILFNATVISASVSGAIPTNNLTALTIPTAVASQSVTPDTITFTPTPTPTSADEQSKSEGRKTRSVILVTLMGAAVIAAFLM